MRSKRQFDAIQSPLSNRGRVYLTGFILFAIALGAYSNTIRAIKQEDFSDVRVPQYVPLDSNAKNPADAITTLDAPKDEKKN